MGAGDGHGSSGGHPLDDFQWSIQEDESGPVVRIHHDGADDAVVGNTSPSSFGERHHRQVKAAVNAGTPADMAAYNALREGDPDFEALRQQMVELVDERYIPDKDERDDITYNPKRFIHEYLLLKDRMIDNERDLPR